MHFFKTVAIAAAFAVSSATAGEIVDATGRTVKMAEPVARVAAAGPPAEVLLYAFAPDALTGWIRDLSPGAAPYITARAKALPVVGAVTAKGEDPDITDVMAKQPQLIVDFGDVDQRYIALAEKVQTRAGVPYVLLDGAVEKMPETFRALGKLTGRAARGEELAAYAADVLGRVEKIAAAHKDNPLKVYVARGADGTVPAMPGAATGDVYNIAGLKNVADSSHGLPGEVKKMDPDVIIALDAKFLDVAKGEAWRSVRAVKAGKIVTPPRLPWGWTDHPPSVGRLLGALWLTSTLYGAPSRPALEAETVKFFKLFYHVDLTPEQTTAVLQ